MARVAPLVVRRAHSGRRGQALVEFALILPVFMLILFAFIDAGRFVFFASTLSQAAREGARAGSVQAYWVGSSDPGCNASGGPTCPANVTALRANITSAANAEMSPFGAIQNVYTKCTAASAPTPSANWTDTTCASNNPKDNISVRVTSTFTAITPIVSSI